MTSFRERVLSYVAGLRIEPGHYRMTTTLGGTLFTDCFAFFLRYLLDDDYDEDEKQALVTRIHMGQDPDTGLWHREGLYPDKSGWHPTRHVDRQLTTFTLSVLATLGVPPRHPLRFLEQWHTRDKVTAFLDGLSWRKNPWNSGNRALFVGSFLAYSATVLGDAKSKAALDAWLEWHDSHARPTSGFWGGGHWADWYVGMGGAAHQYLVYDYCQRTPPHLKAAIDRTLRLQFYDGRYWPVAGSGSCYELDAVEILQLGYKKLDHRRSDIEQACKKMLPIIFACQNPDGGFCWARRRWFDIPDTLRTLPTTGNLRTIGWSLFMQANAHRARKKESRITSWTDGAHPVTESSLYDTWFRVLTLALIDQIIEDTHLPDVKWRSLPSPNWGFF
jgi:hypothetical protein